MDDMTQKINIPEYHNVIANSLALIPVMISQKSIKEAEALIRYNITYAYTLYKMQSNDTIDLKNIKKEVEALKLEGLSLPDLVVTMVYYQSEAGIKPVQTVDFNAKVFDRVQKEITG